MNKSAVREASNKYSLYIPRASLSSSSSSGLSSKSSSRSREFSPNPMDKSKSADEISGESEMEGVYNSSSIDENKSYRDNNPSRKANHPMYIVYKGGKPKRTFDSTATHSSSSSASNQSNHSVNSLLLSVKNLEDFNRKVENVNVNGDNKLFNKSDNVYRKQMLDNIKNVITNDSKNDLKQSKKEPDQLSTTSSATNTNFTVITFNGFGKNNRKKSRAICRRRHQVTILIIIMTFLLFVGIFFAVCMLEMRYQKMPR